MAAPLVYTIVGNSSLFIDSSLTSAGTKHDLFRRWDVKASTFDGDAERLEVKVSSCGGFERAPCRPSVELVSRGSETPPLETLEDGRGALNPRVVTFALLRPFIGRWSWDGSG